MQNKEYSYCAHMTKEQGYKLIMILSSNFHPIIVQEYKAILSVLRNDNSLPVVFLAAPPEADREVEDFGY